MRTSSETSVPAPDPVIAYTVFTVGIPALVVFVLAVVLNWVGR